MKRLVIAVAFAVALLLVLAAPARADYKDDFKKGIEAIDRKNWAEAARLMRQAAAAQGKEGEQIKLYGMRFEPYLPHYYLGLALYQSGDCRGAVQSWGISQSQGQVKGGQAKILATNLKTCQDKLIAEGPKPTQPVAPPPTAAAPPPTQVAQAMPAAPPVTAPPATMGLKPAGPSGPIGPSGPVGPSARPSAESKPLGPPPQLVAGAQALFSARYREAVSALEQVNATGNAAAQAALLRAAARYALYAMSGEKDEPLRQQAADDVKACRQIAASLTPDQQYFSPKFIKFFNSTR